MNQLPVTEAALRLGVTYHKVRAMVLTGSLRGGRDAFGRLYVDEDSVESLRAEKGSSSKRGGGDGPPST